MCFAAEAAGCDNYLIVYHGFVELWMFMVGWSPDLLGTFSLVLIIALITYIAYRESHPLA